MLIPNDAKQMLCRSSSFVTSTYLYERHRPMSAARGSVQCARWRSGLLGLRSGEWTSYTGERGTF